MLSTQTFASYHREIKNASALVLEPRLTRLSNGRWSTFNLATSDLDAGAELRARREAEVQAMREETAQEPNAPLWLSLPVQLIVCVLYAMFLLFCCIAAIGLGPLYLVSLTACKIVAGLRWALC